MTWTRTHERWVALSGVRAQIERRQDGELPWSPELAEVFGTRRMLLLALHYQWKLTLTARIDNAVELDGPGGARPAARQLAEQNPGLRRVLERHLPSLPAVEEHLVTSFGGHPCVPTPA